MKPIKARLFDKQSSGFDDVTLAFKEDYLHLSILDKTVPYKINDITVSQRLGNMPRFIYFKDGKVCECEDNDSIDAELKKRKLSPAARLIHHLESKSIYILPALSITALIVFAFLKYVVPYSAEKIAHALPQDIASKIGTGTLVAMDKLVLEPTHLGEAKQKS